jgi:hypothetical protein
VNLAWWCRGWTDHVWRPDVHDVYTVWLCPKSAGQMYAVLMCSDAELS